MIISLVSKYVGAGKTHAAYAVEEYDWTKYHTYQLTNALYYAADILLGQDDKRDKYEPHPELGVGTKQLVNEIAKAVEAINPDITTHRVMSHIERSVASGVHVIIHDTRRERDFVRLDEIAQKHGTHHSIIEVVPTGIQLEESRPDTWRNGLEPCGHDVWRYRHHYYATNDGTENFERDVVELVERMTL
jgi:hypothetical protein